MATGLARRTQTSTVGICFFGAVPIGNYKIEVEKTGFQTWEGTFTLDVTQNAVVNAALKVGTTTTVVEVNGAARPSKPKAGRWQAAWNPIKSAISA
jgi:hypothetical protein